MAPLKPVSNREAAWQTYRAQQSRVTQWRAEGLLGIRLPNRAENAQFTWLQTGNDYTIDFYGPLGLGSTRLVGASNSVSLTLHDGRIVSADNAEDLMQQNLGWQLPVEGAQYWLRGLPAPTSPYTNTLNAYGLLNTLNQDGWQITYLNYQLFNGWPLAHKMLLKQGDLQLTVILNNWQDSIP